MSAEPPARALRTLLFSTLFPNAAQPRHGIFVENRLRHLLAGFPVSATVVAPVPWFFSNSERFGAWAAFARVPRAEVRAGTSVLHPRYVVIPKLSWYVAPLLLYAAARACVGQLLKQGARFDIIDAHYVYPDGVAATMLAREFNLPVVVSARGSDIALLSNYRVPRWFLRRTFQNVNHSIAVCEALKESMTRLGAEPGAITVLRNGVDLSTFRPESRSEAQQRLQVSGRVLLSVGNLIELKGHHLVIQALQQLDDATLVIVGEGPEQARLREQAVRLGVAERVRFAGLVPHDELRWYYSAADALVLASSREGWANVLLEAMACGTPVVATAVWGTPEVVAAPEAGVLIEKRTPQAIAAGVNRLLRDPPARAATRRYAERFSWEATSRGQYELFREVIRTHRARKS